MRTFERIFAVRSAVQVLLEAARRDKIIGKFLEARLVIHAAGEAGAFLRAHAKELPTYFIVSQVEIADSLPEGAQPLAMGPAFGVEGKISARVEPARGERCPRCWTYSESVGRGSEVCDKCREALS